MSQEKSCAQPAPRPFTAVKAFADSVLAMLDERIKAVDQAAHPFNDYFGDKPETIVAAKAQAGELREVRTQVRILADRALVELMKFKPAIPAPEGEDIADLRESAAMLNEIGVILRNQQDRFVGSWGEIVRQMCEALAAPAPQAPVALTDEQIAAICKKVVGIRPGLTCIELVRAIEAAHGIPAPQTKEPGMLGAPEILPQFPMTKEPTNDR